MKWTIQQDADDWRTHVQKLEDQNTRQREIIQELTQAVETVIPLLRMASYPDKKDSPLIKRFEEVLARSRKAIVESK